MASQDFVTASIKRQAAFQRLRPVCSQLLQHRNDAAVLSQELRQLQQVVSTLDVESLSGCWDYISFPLLLIIDSISLCKVARPRPQQQPHGSSQPSSSTPPPEESPEPPVPAAKSDRVSEAVLDVLLALSQRVAQYVEADQAVEALQRLSPLLQLPRDTTSEETQACVFQCIAALLNTGVVDDQAAGASAAPTSTNDAFGTLDLDLESLVVSSLAEADALSAAASATGTKSGRSVLSQTLAAEASAPLVGFIVSSVVAAADAETAAGPKGSKLVRAAALRALQAVIRAVNDRGALSFFLPGITTGLCKQLLAATARTAAASDRGTGAGGSTVSLVVEVLADVVELVLGDAAIQGLMGPTSTAGGGTASSQGAQEQSAGAETAASTALAALQQLALGSTLAQPAGPHPAAGSTAQPAPSRSTSSQAGMRGPGSATKPGRLRVDVTKEWAESSCARVSGLLLQVLPPLAAHPRPSVRQALAHAAVRLLSSCRLCLGPQGTRVLMEVVLSLAQDEWPHVAQVAMRWLSGEDPASLSSGGAQSQAHEPQGSAQGGGGTTSGAQSRPATSNQGSSTAPSRGLSASSGSGAAPVPPELLQDMIEGLAGAVRHGDTAGTLHARKLAAALLHAGVAGAAQHVLLRPARLSAMVAGLAHCFFFDPLQAAQALHMRTTEGGVYTALPAPTGSTQTPSLPPSSADSSATTSAAQTDAADSSESSKHARTDDATPELEILPKRPPAVEPQASTSAAVQLPRMPLCLLHISSQRCYEAVAGVARTLGHLARVADMQGAGSSRTHLRRLCDLLASMLQEAALQAEAAQPQGQGRSMRDATEEAEQEGRGLLSDAPSWQCAAAAAACLSAEVLFGACALWSPPFPARGTPAGACKPSGPDASFEASALLLLEQYVGGALWSVPTANSAPSQTGEEPGPHSTHSIHSSSSSSAKSAAELGQNALLVRALAEACGAAGRALGPRLAASGRTLRTALMPLLERSADPCNLVANAAATSLTVIAHACGYGGSLRTMLSMNADYVVDALCAQLRDLDTHPRAPLLLAALLRRSGGVGPELLPRMAEPLGAVLRGLSPLARRRQPTYTAAFLSAAFEVARGAALEAADAAEIARQAQTELRARVEQAGKEREAKVEAAAAAALAAEGRGSPGDAPAGDAARAYFQARAALRAKENPELSGVRFGQQEEKSDGAGAESVAWSDSWKKGIMGAADIELMDERFRRLHAAAVAASAGADAAAPLMLSADLRVAQAAIDVCVSSLAALAPSTRALEGDTQLFEELGPTGLVRPAPPETPKLLPTVAALWPPLVVALQDARTPLVERALELLATVTRVGGGVFMARRFQQEASPVLARLLASGTAHTPAAAGGTLGGGRHSRRSTSATARESAPAPGALQRVRAAALGCLAAVCSCSSAWAAVKGLTWGIAQAALPFLAPGHGEVLQGAACRVLQAVAEIDPDSVWLLLVDVVRAAPDDSYSQGPALKSMPSAAPRGSSSSGGGGFNVAAAAAPGANTAPGHASAPTWAGIPAQPPGPQVPPIKRLLPPLPSTGGTMAHVSPSARVHTPTPAPSFTSPSLPWPVTPALAAECAGRARSLLAKMEYLQAPAIRAVHLDVGPVGD